MKTIWKYEIEVADTQYIEMPRHAEILDVQSQNYVCVMWVLVNPGIEKTKRRINIFGTGNPVHDNHGKYIATFQDTLGLVWHIFDGGEL